MAMFVSSELFLSICFIGQYCFDLIESRFHHCVHFFVEALAEQES